MVHYPRRHNLTELFVKMVFSDKNKILIKNLYQSKGYNARQLRTKWTTSSINRLFKKFRHTVQWTDVRAATDREVPAQMKTMTNDMVLSQGNQPQTHSTVRIIIKDLKELKCFKR